jgi:hypothetical protein
MNPQRQDVMDNNHDDWIDYLFCIVTYAEKRLRVLYRMETRFISCTFYSVGEEIL